MKWKVVLTVLFVLGTTTSSLPCSCSDINHSQCQDQDTSLEIVEDSCDIPAAQQYGDWFCPPSPSGNSVACHLECHPGYVSNKRTVISCTDGLWSSSPVCVEAIGLITGNYEFPGDTVEVYGEGKHEMLPSLPEERYAHTLDMTDGYILLCGGVWEQACLELTPSLDWRTHSTTTSLRNGHSSVSILGQLHLLGGGDSPTTTEHLSPSRATTWIPGHDLLEETDWACAARIHPEVFIVTGGDHHPSSVISYNVTSGAAIRLQDMMSPRQQHGCLYVKKSQNVFRGFLVAGGWDSDIYLSQSELLNLSTGQWTQTGALTRPRRGVQMMTLGHKILAFGGEDGSMVSATVDRFNVTSLEWSAAEEMLEPRWFHAVAGVPQNLLQIEINHN